MLTVNVVQRPVKRLGHHRHRPHTRVLKGLSITLDHPSGHRVMHHSDRMCVGDADRPQKVTRILDPVAAGHLTIAVQHKGPGPYRLWPTGFSMRQDRSHPGANRTLAWHQGSPIRDHRRHSDSHPSNIGDRVPRTGLTRKIQPQITRPWFRHSSAPCRYCASLAFPHTGAYTPDLSRGYLIASPLVYGFGS